MSLGINRMPTMKNFLISFRAVLAEPFGIAYGSPVYERYRVVKTGCRHMRSRMVK